MISSLKNVGKIHEASCNTYLTWVGEGRLHRCDVQKREEEKEK